MNFINNYIKYLKDNPKNLWFKRKLYGWGWVPVTWQGWVTILVFVTLLTVNTFLLPYNVQPTSSEIIWLFVRESVIIAALIYVCYKKGDKPRWQWSRDLGDK